MTHCPPICGKRKQEEKRKEVKKVERDKDKETLKKLVPKRFWRWRKVFGKNTSMKNLGPCHRVEGKIYTKKEKDILTVQGGKRGDASICRRPTKKRIYLPFQVTPNVTSTLRSKEG